jgi:hypothetical protein
LIYKSYSMEGATFKPEKRGFRIIRPFAIFIYVLGGVILLISCFLSFVLRPHLRGDIDIVMKPREDWGRCV